MKIIMDEITLCSMTRELCHRFFRDFENDPAVFCDADDRKEYQYSKEQVDLYFDRQKQQHRIVFAIMREGAPIGEIQLKDIDETKKECTLSIHMQNDRQKGKGYGTIAEQLAVDYAFKVLGMEAVNADTLLKNERSRRVLEKAGFQCVGRDEGFWYYRKRKNS